MPLLGTLIDSFNDNVVDPVKWPNSYGTYTETGGRARVTCDTNFNAYASATVYTLAGSEVRCQVFPPVDGGATSEAWAQVQISTSTAGTDAIIEVNAATGNLMMSVRTGFFDPGSVSIAYNPVTHAWLRIREAAGTMYWETSPDGAAWTVRRSTTSPSWVSDTNLQAQLISHRDGGTNDFSFFDNFNITLSKFETLTDNFDDNVVDTAKWPSNYNTAGALPDEVGGRARVPCGTGFAAYASDTLYQLQNSYVHSQVTPPSGTGSSAYCQMVVLSDVAGTQALFQINAVTNTLLMTLQTAFVDEGGQSIAYNPVNHAWLRLRETSGTLLWQTSPDGRSWMTRHSFASPAWVSQNNLQVQLLAHRTSGPADFAFFDNFNITPVLPDGYTVAVDWASDGNFVGPFDDVTDDVLSRGAVNFSYGRDQSRQLAPPVVGSISFSLCNADRIYSPENPDSPIAEEASPASPVKVEVVVDDVLYPLIRGRIDELDVHPDRSDRSADITALDGLALLQGTEIHTEVYEARRTGFLIGIILDAVGWTAPRDIDLGATHVPWWWAEGTDAFTAMVDLLQSEGPPSIAYIAPDGTFTFRDRHHRLVRPASLVSQAAFAAREVACDSPMVTGFSYLPPFEYSYGWRDIVNVVSFTVDERHPDESVTVVWESDSITSMTLGQTIQIQVQSNDPFREAQDLLSGTDIVFTGPGTPATSISRRSGQSLIISITAVGGALTIKHLQVRARLIPVDRMIQVSAEDSVSIARHGRRSYKDDAPWASQHDAFAITQLLLAHYAQRRPTVQLRIVSSDMAHWLQVLTRAISDLITIRNGELGLDTTFHIERLQHTIRRFITGECPGPVHYAVLGCERSGLVVATNPFTFDKVGAGFDQGVFDPTAADNPATIFIFDHPTQGQFNVGAFAT